MTNYTDLVPIPPGINQGLHAAQQHTMQSLLGIPGTLTNDCSGITNAALQTRMVTRRLGAFAVTGLVPAVEAIARVLERVQRDEPALYAVLGTAGMLCCRRVRAKPGGPPSPNFSNHSWGTAIDISIGGRLDPRSNDTCQRGLLILAPYFHAEGFFWGAGFAGSSEDAMHFEVAEETIRSWHNGAG